MRPDWTKCNLWLVPVNKQAKKRETRWACVCDECQQERIVGYCFAWDIVKGKYPRTCKPCRLRLGLIKNPGNPNLGKNPVAQQKAILARTGIKRSSTTKRLELQHLFAPETMLTPEIRAKQRAAKLGKRGSLTSGWKGGKTNERKLAIARDEYKQLRKGVFQRDNWTCQGCGERGGRLELHHIKEWSNYPDLRYEPANCITICRPCHTKTDNYASKAIKAKDSNGIQI